MLTQAEPRLHSLGDIEALAPTADLTVNPIIVAREQFRSPIATIAALAALVAEHKIRGPPCYRIFFLLGGLNLFLAFSLALKELLSELYG